MERPGFLGYRVAAVSGLAFFCTGPGQTLIVSEFNRPLREEFGISESGLSTAYMVATIAASLPLVYVGGLIDRLGPRVSLAAVAGLFGLACIGFGMFVQGLMTVGLGFFLLRFLGQGSLGVAATHATAMWFHRRLGVVDGVKNVAVFGLWAILPLVVNASIQGLGWRATYAMLGMGVTVLVIPSSLVLVRDRPEDVGQRLDGDGPERSNAEVTVGRARAHLGTGAELTLAQAWKTRAYWGVILPNMLGGLVGTALLFSRQPMAASAGLSDEVAAGAAAAWAWTMAIAALPSGWLADRYDARLLFAIGLLGLAGATGVYLVADTPIVFMGGMVVFGLAQAITQVASNTSLARYFGRRHHGAIRASASRLLVLGTAMGPVILGVSNDVLGGYGPGLIAMIALCAPVAAITLSMRVPESPPASADAA